MLILNKEDSIYAATKIINYFNNFKRIDDYFRVRKIERIKNLPIPLPGMKVEDCMFQSYDMHPEDMNFEIVEYQKGNTKTYNDMLEIVASFSVDNAPGKEMKLVVKETNTNSIVGFIKLGSPIINSKPRNDYLGGVPDLSIFNKRAIMGFNIVPVQPFGYNYLGGKLLAAICNSHDVRRMLNKKYNTEFCLFETTSLYGNIKGVSMYDGMKPYLKYKGDTQSKFLLTLSEDIYFELKNWFITKNNGEEIIHKAASSRKLKTQTKMVSIIRASLKVHDLEFYDVFCKSIKTATSITTQKRFYMGEYGYSNVKDILLGKKNVLTKGEHFDKLEFEKIIEWWKKFATKRYNKMVAENKVRKELEIWNRDTISKIDIIR